VTYPGLLLRDDEFEFAASIAGDPQLGFRYLWSWFSRLLFFLFSSSCSLLVFFFLSSLL